MFLERMVAQLVRLDIIISVRIISVAEVLVRIHVVLVRPVSTHLVAMVCLV